MERISRSGGELGKNGSVGATSIEGATATGEEKRLDATYRKLGNLANDDLTRNNETHETTDLANISDTYKRLAYQELYELGKTDTYHGATTFEELEAAAGVAQLIKIGVECLAENSTENSQILEAIIAKNPSPDATTQLKDFINRYEGNEKFLVRDVFPKMHEEWIKIHEKDFVDLAQKDSTMYKCAEFLPFGMIGYKRMLKYARLSNAFTEFDESAIKSFYDSYVEDQQITGEYDEDYGIDDYRSPREVFENDTEILCEEAADLYRPYKLPKAIDDTLYGNKKLAKAMAYHYTFGEASPWSEGDKREAFLDMID